jgi:TonB family protein
MAHTGTWSEPYLPWSDSDNDRRFKILVIVSIALFTLIWGVIRLLPAPEVEQKALKDVSPRLAKLIIEKQNKPKPPPKPKEKKKEKPKEKKTEKPKEKKPKPKPEQKAARKKAENSGIMAMQDELADLRESFDVASIESNKPVVKNATSAVNTNNAKDVIAARAGKSSGGIDTRKLSRATGGGSLEGRQTTKVQSNIQSGGNARRSGSSKGSGHAKTRGEEEIELVFQKNKGSIFSMYNRELRKDPTLRGKVVLELTIAPSGRVTAARIVSSELHHPELERKLVARVKLFRFKAKDVATITVTYPIDFLPS